MLSDNLVEQRLTIDSPEFSQWHIQEWRTPARRSDSHADLQVVRSVGVTCDEETGNRCQCRSEDDPPGLANPLPLRPGHDIMG